MTRWNDSYGQKLLLLSSNTHSDQERKPQSILTNLPHKEELAPSKSCVSIAFMGDTSLGDAYLSRPSWAAEARRLDRDPWSFFEHVAPLTDSASIKFMNLETVLSECPIDPFNGRKRYQGWDRPDRTLHLLKQMGVTAVSLGNNHTLDYGLEPFRQMVRDLDKKGIAFFGAGETLNSAVRPLCFLQAQRAVHVFAGFEYRRRYNTFYATETRAGLSPLVRDDGDDLVTKIAITRTADPNALIFVFPHWSGVKNYRWATVEMIEMNRKLLSAGADLIIGHGAHMIQEIIASTEGTTVFSLGNFVFNSPGRYKKNNAPGYSFVARLDIEFAKGTPTGDLRLYPIVSDNRRTGFRPRPVTESEMADVVAALKSRPLCVGFESYLRVNLDSRGFHLQVLGDLSPRLKGSFKNQSLCV